jgi:hypothetical protein
LHFFGRFWTASYLVQQAAKECASAPHGAVVEPHK